MCASIICLCSGGGFVYITLMKISALPEGAKRKMYHLQRELRRRHKVAFGVHELYEHLLKLKFQRMGLEKPVLSSRDGSWALESLFWKERSWAKKGYYKSRGRFYLRTGGGFATEKEAIAAVAGKLEELREKEAFNKEWEALAAAPVREQGVERVVTKDWSEDTAFNQTPSYDGF